MKGEKAGGRKGKEGSHKRNRQRISGTEYAVFRAGIFRAGMSLQAPAEAVASVVVAATPGA